jgi:cytoskeleton protein RodZ
VVIVLLGYGVWHLMAPSGDSSQQVPPPPVLNPPKPRPKPAPQPIVAPAQTATPPAAADAVPPAPAAGAPGQQAAASPPPAAGAKTPATSTTQMAAPPTSQASATPPAAQTGSSQAAVPTTDSQTFGAANTNSRVVLRARGPVRVTVKGPDGSVLLNRDLQAGDIYQAPNEPGITLATSDGGALEMDVDGKNLGTVGQPQQVLGRVSLEPESLMERFRTH